MSNKQPNIIFIMSDQHNANVMGNAGDSYVRTPNLDKLYEESTSFDNCYSNSPLCVPSRASMLSGLYPCNNGVYNNMQSLPYHRPTFVNMLTNAGYETVLSGRMHFVGYDQRHGFETRLVGDITPAHMGMSGMMEHMKSVYGEFAGTSGQNQMSIKTSGAGESAVLKFDEEVFSAAIDHIKNRENDEPLFMTVGLYGPHCPYVAPKELFDYYYETLPEIDVTDEYKDNIHDGIKKWYVNRDMQNTTKEDVKRVRAAYYGMVEYLDTLVGDFLGELEQLVDMDNTIVIYTSDHGDSIGEHGLFWKSNFYEGASRVPLAFKWNGNIDKNKRIKELVSLVDIAPTLLDAASSNQLPQNDKDARYNILTKGERLEESYQLPKYDGDTLYNALTKGEELEDRAILSFCSDTKGDAPSAMVRKGEYKLVVHAGYEAVQLFNIENDPSEVNDLGKNPEYASIIRELRSELDGLWNEEDAIKELKVSIEDMKIMFKWMDSVPKSQLVTEQEKSEQWYGENAKNYIAK